MTEEQEIKRNRNLVIIFLLFLSSMLCFGLTDPSQNQMTYAACEKKADNFIANSEKKIIEGVELGILKKDGIYQAREQAEQKHFENIVLCNDLDAQQAMSARTHWGLFFGVWGLLTIVATLWQTSRAAGAAALTLVEAGKATALAKKTSKAEFQPYLTFAKKIEISNAMFSQNGSLITSVRVIKEGIFLKIKGSINIINEGKTPVLSGYYVSRGTMWKGDSTYHFSNEGTFSYLGASKPEKINAINRVVLEEEGIADGKFDIADMRFTVNLRVSFFDAFDKKKRRVFMANYSGGYVMGTDLFEEHFRPLFLEEYAEVEPEERDYPEHDPEA